MEFQRPAWVDSPPSVASEILNSHVNKITNMRLDNLETFVKAFMESTGLTPQECELVEKQNHATGEVVWFCRKREIQADAPVVMGGVKLKLNSWAPWRNSAKQSIRGNRQLHRMKNKGSFEEDCIGGLPRAIRSFIRSIPAKAYGPMKDYLRRLANMADAIGLTLRWGPPSTNKPTLAQIEAAKATLGWMFQRRHSLFSRSGVQTAIDIIREWTNRPSLRDRKRAY